MIFKSKRPTYAIILFAVCSLWMCALFLPLLHFVVFPNQSLQEVVSALEERGTPPPEARAAVEQTIAAAGALTRAIPVAYYSGVTTSVGVNGSHTFKTRQASYIAWFQNHPKALVLVITDYQNDDGRSAYALSEGDPVYLGRGYAIPVLLFGVSVFLVSRKKSNTPTPRL